MAGIVTRRGVSKRRVGIDFSDVEQWENLLRSQSTRIDRAADELEFKNAKELAKNAQRLAPRSRGSRSPASQKYGPLHRQLKAEKLTDVSKVGIGSAFYGYFQEKGTSRMNANPFFAPAIKKQRRPFKKDAVELVQKLLRRTRF